MRFYPQKSQTPLTENEMLALLTTLDPDKTGIVTYKYVDSLAHYTFTYNLLFHQYHLLSTREHHREFSVI